VGSLRALQLQRGANHGNSTTTPLFGTQGTGLATVGNPIDTRSGLKFEQVLDFTTEGAAPRMECNGRP
jgi:hypothetical protein